MGVTAYCNLLAARIVERINEVFDNDNNTEKNLFCDLADFFFIKLFKSLPICWWCNIITKSTV